MPITSLDQMPDQQSLRNVTFYLKQDMTCGLSRFDAKMLRIEVRQYAQYERGILLHFTCGRQRRERFVVVSPSHPFFAVIPTTAAVEPDSMIDPSTKSTSQSGAYTVTTGQGRYGSCDPRWVTDFLPKIETQPELMILINETGKVRP